MAYQDELKIELSKDKYSSIMQEPDARRNGYLAAMMNAPAITEEANPEPRGKVAMIPDSMQPILDLMDPAELGAVYTTKFAAMMAAAAPTAGEQVRALSNWMHTDEDDFDLEWPVAKAGQQIIRSKNVGAINDLIAIMAAAGMLDEQTVTDLRNAMMIDDPNWTPNIYSHDQSIAEANGWPTVTPADVQEALE